MNGPACSAKGFPSKPDDKRLYCNINSPFTAVGKPPSGVSLLIPKSRLMRIFTL